MPTDTLKRELQSAYVKLTDDLNRIGRNAQHEPCFPADDAQVQIRVQQAAARCGAAIGAAVKREKRRLLISSLLDAKASGIDVTPAVAQQTSKRILGRGLDGRFTAQHFSTPGRTAADKSPVTANDLAELEEEVMNKLKPLLVDIEAKKQRANRDWHNSQSRLAVLADWSQQRYELSQGSFRFGRGFMNVRDHQNS